MAVKLSVDRISEDGSIGCTSNPMLIIKNQSFCEPLLNKYPNQNHMCFSAGRYMCFMMINPMHNQPELMFVDFKKDKDAASFTANTLALESDRELFMDIYDMSYPNYERDYNEVELVLDESLPQHSLSLN